MGITSLEQLSAEDMILYHHTVLDDDTLSISQKRSYKNLIEPFILSYHLGSFPIIEDMLFLNESVSRPLRNKITTCLMMLGIYDPSDIDYDVRENILHYLTQTLAPSKVNSYIKVLDQLKLEIIKKQNLENPFRDFKLFYEEQKIFLLYHPDYRIATSFYYVQDKEDLLFDFSLAGEKKLKLQIFSMLNYVLDEIQDPKARRERFLIPLKLLYLYCINNHIPDIEMMDIKQIEGFRSSMRGNVGTKEDDYMQIVYNICQFLFCNSPETNWNANVWFLQRFHLNEDRLNPARPIISLSFRMIASHENRTLFKIYIKYLITLTDISMQNIRTKYYDIKHSLQFFDEESIDIRDINKNIFERLIQFLSETHTLDETFNRCILNTFQFLHYLNIRQLIDIPTLYPQYYLKKVLPKHNDRSVSESVQNDILYGLKYLPLKHRLMFLNLWCVGLRINEVCCITADAYSWDGDTAWITIRQYKLRTEKRIPIPTELYKLMRKYIKEHQYSGKEFVFKNKRGGAYDAGTFTKQMTRELSAIGINTDEYWFQSHDFRHTIATLLYRHGASIQTIRDYLGHSTEEMTKKYIDWIPAQINSKSSEYFNNTENYFHLKTRKGEPT
ncbi:MAG: site-specific integrase [Eubacteriales bacterium]|nr:site-specific integrase [Eubacteriales bacterium]